MISPIFARLSENISKKKWWMGVSPTRDGAHPTLPPTDEAQASTGTLPIPERDRPVLGPAGGPATSAFFFCSPVSILI